MRPLFDENLSFRLTRLLADVYPGSTRVRDVGLKGAADEEIWAHAAAGGFVLVSKDVDFYQRSIMRGAPPKVVWLRVGNGATGSVGDLLRSAAGALERFVADEEAAFLPLGPLPPPPR